MLYSLYEFLSPLIWLIWLPGAVLMFSYLTVCMFVPRVQHVVLSSKPQKASLSGWVATIFLAFLFFSAIWPYTVHMLMQELPND
jgi:NADH:ubiquinone oxidoreductase subunit 6 (subunit J)